MKEKTFKKGEVKRRLGVLLGLVLMISLAPAMKQTVSAAEATIGGYTIYVPEGVTAPELGEGSVIEVTSTTKNWTDGNWYVVKDDVTMDTGEVIDPKAAIISGDVNLILCDGATLNVACIKNPLGQQPKLTIWAQSTGDNVGKLIVNNIADRGMNIYWGMTINGGEIDVTSSSIGINISRGDLIINEGKIAVTVASGEESAIVLDDGNFTLNNGELVAKSNNRGMFVRCGSITIANGEVQVSTDKNGTNPEPTTVTLEEGETWNNKLSYSSPNIKYVKICKPSHVHKKGTHHEAVAGTCTTKGTLEYWDCEETVGGECEKYLDADGNVLESIEGEIDSSNHPVEETFSKDETGHWYGVSCGHEVKKSEAAHTYGEWTVTKLATATEAGEKERSCKVCGFKEVVATSYEKPEDHPESDPNAGIIENTTDAKKNGCNADVELTKHEIIEKFELTPAELSKVENGVHIAVNLEVKAEDPNNIPQADITVAEKKIESGEKIGQYLDINLFKIIGEDKSKVTQLNGKIKIQINLPEEVKKAGSDYFIIRVHDGVATKLALTLVSGDTYSFETDQFSTYAIGYKDNTAASAPEETKTEETAPAEETATETKPAAPKTGDTTNMYQWILLMVVGFGVCAMAYAKRRDA